MSSRGKFKFRAPRGAALIRKLDTEKLRDWLFKSSKRDAGWVYQHTHNRDARRFFARAMRQHGRGYTKPVRGRSHTRGSGRTRH